LGRLRCHDLRHSVATDVLLRLHNDAEAVSEFLDRSDPATTIAVCVHPDDKMCKGAVMRQNSRVTAALAKAEHDSRLVRDKVIPLRRAVG